MKKRPSPLPILVVTGASGFIGRHFIEQVKTDFYIYAIARRSQQLVHIEPHENIRWIQLDIGIREMVTETMAKIRDNGGADFIIHLAGYYDFSNEDSIEYERTNIKGTEHILEHAESLGIKRFLYASSLTVSEFDKNGTIIDENSPADATFPYALSKTHAEQMVNQYAHSFPCAIMRLAAIYSDWCEYGPLYMFLSMWTTKTWKSRIISGNGSTAIPYLHVNNMNGFLLKIIEMTESLPPCPVLIASTKGCSDHNSLYDIATRYVFRSRPQPVHLPKWFSAIGVILLDILGRLRGKRPFERLWMIRYVNKKLDINPTATYKMLDWKPVPRYSVERRLLFLIENMKSNPYEWDYKNYEAIYKTQRPRPSMQIYEVMLRVEDEIVDKIVSELQSADGEMDYGKYRDLEREKLNTRITYIYEMLKTSVRTGDRLHIVHYGRDLALKRFLEGFDKSEVSRAVSRIGEIVVEVLSSQAELRELSERVRTDILMTIQLGIDEIEDSFEQLTGFTDD